MDESAAEAERIAEKGLSVALAQALGDFRTELAKYEVVDLDEAQSYAEEYLAHLLCAWLGPANEE